VSHARTTILAAVRAALTGLPTTGANVHTDRARPMPNELPLLVVEPVDEQSRVASRVDVDAWKIERVLGVAVGVLATSEEEREQVCSEVEQRMTTVDFGVFAVELRRTQLDASAEGDARRFGAVLNYGVTYHTLNTDASSII
jgi:hypothetical protein